MSDSWIACADRMPNREETVLFCLSDSWSWNRIQMGRYNSVHWYPRDDTDDYYGTIYQNKDVTHWMPLPGRPNALPTETQRPPRCPGETARAMGAEEAVSHGSEGRGAFAGAQGECEA